ncbi:MAG: NAD-dependent epimerase/dehydratase family protein [Planctomycetes bacterium]|nr:NAD-dependent epimerase/dehydratase family protein [Planctomycetota bacterium]
MKTLVTGGAGFIGSHIVDAFINQGHDVVVVDNLFTGKMSNLNPKARFYQLDIVSAALDEVIGYEKPEVISHQAARVDVRASMSQPFLYAQTNVLGSVNLLESCRRHGVKKVIYAQTGGCVYGEPKELPSPESHVIQPVDPYGVSKYLMELYLKCYAHQFNIHYTVLRYPNVYGPRQDPSGEAGVVSIFAKQMLSGTQAIINGTGEQLRDYVYCTDIVNANLLALDKGDNEIYNTGSGVGTSVNKIFAMLKEITNYQRDPVYAPPRSGEVLASYLDSKKAERDLGWKASVGLEVGLRKTVEFIRGKLH